jgi:HEPN pEK499 p136
METIMHIDRNTIEGFAERTRKNLRFIVAAYDEGQDVHTVTQLINSLLGLIVYLCEYYGLERFDKLPLSTIYPDRCPWDFSPIEGIVERRFAPPASFGALLRHVRNGIAHRNIHFGSTSRDLRDVDVVLWGRRPKGDRGGNLVEPPHWCAKINAVDLEQFTEMLASKISNS